MSFTGYEIDKLQIASLRLADTINGFYMGNSVITTIDSARAANAIIIDIRNFLEKKKFIPKTSLWSDDRTQEHPRDVFWVASNFANRSVRSFSNFTKHAKTDTDAIKDVWPFLDLYSLAVASIDYQQLLSSLRNSGLITENEHAIVTTPYGKSSKEEAIAKTLLYFIIEWGKAKDKQAIKQKYFDILKKYNLWPLNEDDLIRFQRNLSIPFRKKHVPTETIDHLKEDWEALVKNHPLSRLNL